MTYIIGGKENNLDLKVEEVYDNIGYKVNLTQEEMARVKKANYFIEMDYELNFLPLMVIDYEECCKQPILLVTLEQSKDERHAHYYYKVNEEQWGKGNYTPNKQEAIHISCYTQGELTYASYYLKTIDVMQKLAISLGRSLVVIGHLKSQLPYYNKVSLAQALVSEYSRKYGSLILLQKEPENPIGGQLSKRNYGPFNHEKIYFVKNGADINDMMKRWLNDWYRTKGSDYFYQKLPKHVEVYSDPFFYENWKWPKTLYDVKQYEIGQGRYLLNGEINQMEQLAEQGLHLPHIPLLKPIKVKKMILPSFINESIYQGKDVYLGLITTSMGSYNMSSLQDDMKMTRVSCMWLQDKGMKGYYYTDETLINWLKAHSEQHELDETTMYLRWMGGNGEGVAQKANFVIAHIKATPLDHAAIYGASTDSVLMGDVMIAAKKLASIAKSHGKPLVLVLPYMPYLVEQTAFKWWLEDFASQEGQVVIVPVGDNGNLRQHSMIRQENNCEVDFEVVVHHEEEQMMLSICAENTTLYEVQLISPRGEIGDLTLAKRQKLGEAWLESTGIFQELDTANNRITLKMSNVQKGKWQLHLIKEDDCIGKISINIEQNNQNNSVYLVPNSCYGTLNAIHCGHVISVGCFRGKQQVLYDFSARGEKGEVPSFVVSNTINKQEEMTSTVEAACFTAGLIACLIEKNKKENKNSKINGNLLKKQIYPYLKRMEETFYPDEGQGYGVLDEKVVKQLLAHKEGWHD